MKTSAGAGIGFPLVLPLNLPDFLGQVNEQAGTFIFFL